MYPLLKKAELKEVCNKYSRKENSEIRMFLHECYMRFIDDLHKDINFSTKQWLCGSYFSDKIDPPDIDLVIFFDPKDFICSKIDKYINKNAMQEYFVDALGIPLYKKDEEKYSLTLKLKNKYYKKIIERGNTVYEVDVELENAI